MNRLPDSVLRLKPGGDEFERVTRRLRTGDVVRVLTGEAFPADGTIVRGSTHADEALLTGESTPVLRAEGEMVTAGSYNLDSVVDVRVDSVGEGTRFAQIVGLMESASLQNRVWHSWRTRWRVHSWSWCCWRHWPQPSGGGRGPWQSHDGGVAVLIVTCPARYRWPRLWPCSLPLAPWRVAVLVRNLQGLEALASVDTLVFDKTGTLTRDGLVLRALTPAEGQSADEVLALAACWPASPCTRPPNRWPRRRSSAVACDSGNWIPCRKWPAAAWMSGLSRRTRPNAAICAWAQPGIAAWPSWPPNKQVGA